MSDLTLTRDEAQAVLSSLEGTEAEYGFSVGAPGPAPSWPLDEHDLELLRAEHNAAAERGESLIRRVRAIADA